MDNYLIFAGDNYYPCGGANDLICPESNYEEAIITLTKKCREKVYTWGHIYSLKDNKIVYTY